MRSRSFENSGGIGCEIIARFSTVYLVYSCLRSFAPRDCTQRAARAQAGSRGKNSIAVTAVIIYEKGKGLPRVVVVVA